MAERARASASRAAYRACRAAASGPIVADLVHLNGGDSHVVVAKPVELLPDARGNIG